LGIKKAEALTGSQTVSPASTTTYTLTCDNGSGLTTTASTTVSVTSSTPTPTVYINSFTASPSSIASGSGSNLSWTTTNASSCTLTGPGSTYGVSTSGSTIVYPTSTFAYELYCTNLGYTPAWASVTVTIGTYCTMNSFSASPTSIYPGGTSTLSWSTSNCNSVTIDGVTGFPGAGSTTVSPASTKQYSMVGTGPWPDFDYMPTPLYTTVTVLPNPPSGSISATSCTISSGSSSCGSILNWSTANLTTTPEVTKNNPAGTHISYATSGTNIGTTITNGSTTFYLYHNGAILSQSSVSASCDGNSSWNGTYCQALVCPEPTTEDQTLSCATGYSGGIYQTRTKTAYPGCTWGDWVTTSNTCTINNYLVSTSAGTGGSISPTSQTVNYNGTTTFTVTPNSGYSIGTVSGCGGSGSYTYTTGAITSACTVTATFLQMAGSLTASDCSISSAGSTCNTSLVWSTTNPIGTSAVTTPTSITVANVNSSVGTSYAISEGATTFYLYNNNILLAQATATATRSVPVVPTGFTATAGSCSTTATNANISSSWTASSGATSYTLNIDGTPTYMGNVTSYSHTSLNAGSSHTYQVKANNSGGSSAYTSVATTTAPSICSYTVSTSAGTGGSISPASRTVNYNGTTTFTITPDTGYSISSVTGCGGSLSGSTYTTGAITAACTVTAAFTINTYTLTVSKAGTGIGSVNSSPAGISCDQGCSTASASYNYGTSVTLTAVASSNNFFSGWSGACTNSTGTCTVSMTEVKNVTASFTAVTVSVSSTTPYTKNISENISFTYTPTTNIYSTECRLLDNVSSALTSYQASSPISYTAPSAAGSYGYYVQCRNSTYAGAAGISNQIIVNVNATLSVATSGNGSGSVTSSPAGISCGSDCSEIYNYGTSVTLTASPSTGSYFAGWSGACSGTSTCTVSMTAARSVTATFTLNTYTLTVTKAGTGNGTVTGAGTYNYGTAVTVGETPDSSSTLVSIGGDCASDGTVSMTSNKTCVVTFAARSDITNLSVSTNPVPYGGTTNFTYSCSNGYYSHLLLDWNWGSSGGWDYSGYYSSATVTSPAITTYGTHTISAYCYNSTWTPSADSWYSVNFSSYAQTPAPDLKVAAWSTGYSATDGPTETYTGDVYTLSWGAVLNASSCTLDGSAVTTSASSTTRTASARTTTHTLICTNATGQSGSDTVTITTPPIPTNVSYSCSPDQMTATVGWDAPVGYNTFYLRTTLNGTPTGSPGWDDNYVGTAGVRNTVAIPVSPNTGYSYWMHSKNTTTGAWSSAPSLWINCERTHTLTYTAGANGTISGVTPQTVNYLASGTQVTAVANTGYTFSSWSDGVTTASRTDSNVTADKAVTASFSINSYYLTVSKAGTGTGTVTSSPAGVNCGSTCSYPFNYNTTVTLTATPSSNSVFSGWSGDCNGSGQVTMTSAKACTATFSLMTGFLTSSASSCVIAENAGSCPVNLTWSVSNPVGSVTAITASGMTNYNSPSVSGGGPTSFTVPYSSRIFYLYNNAIELASRAVTSSCISGTTWDSVDGRCERVTVNLLASPNPVEYNRTTSLAWSSANATSCTASGDWSGTKATSGNYTTGNLTSNKTYTLTCTNPDTTSGSATASVSVGIAPTGTLSGADCSIALNASTCPTTLTLAISNPISVASTNITKPVNVEVASLITPAAKSGIAVAYGGTTFYLNHDGSTLATKTVGASCVSGTTWDSVDGRCEGISVAITATPATVEYNRASSISWTSTNATACTLSGGGITGTGTSNAGVSTGALTSEKIYTVSCTGDNGTTGSDSVTVYVGVAPTGTLTGSDCQIAANASTCTTSLTLNVTNPISTAATNVTKPVNIEVISNATINRVFPKTVSNISVAYPSTTFYLNHDGSTLATKTVGVSCVSGTIWNGSVCALPTGTITAPNCTISEWESNCNSSVTWSTINPLVGVASSVTSAPSLPVSANSGTQSYSIDHGTRTFTLTHNYIQLATSTATASCASGTTWEGGVCTPPTGTISAGASPTCQITAAPQGDGHCNITLSWDTSDTIGPTSVTTPTNVTVASGDSGTATYSMSYESRTFYLYNSGRELGSVTATATCDADSTWNGVDCALNAPTGTLIASPETIFKGRSSTLNWSSHLANSCTGTGFSTGGATVGSIKVSPLVNTTYSVVCTRPGFSSEQATVTVQVVDPVVNEN
jgi:hypothetical protein